MELSSTKSKSVSVKDYYIEVMSLMFPISPCIYRGICSKGGQFIKVITSRAGAHLNGSHSHQIVVINSGSLDLNRPALLGAISRELTSNSHIVASFSILNHFKFRKINLRENCAINLCSMLSLVNAPH